MEYAGKKVAVIGLAVSNTPLIRYLVENGADVTVFDKKESHELDSYMAQLADLKVDYVLGESYLTKLTGFDDIFVTPGMRKNIPEFQRARDEGSIFSSEMELFFKKCPAPIIGITGSSGKTTTTTLIGEMIRSQYEDTYVGGNIGRSLMGNLSEMNPDTKVILELSSFQLQELKQSPKISAITNITPNHLDMHASMEEYIEAKSNILRFQDVDDLAILNYDYQITRDLGALTKAKIYYFSRMRPLDEGAFLDGDKLVVRLDGKTEVVTTRQELKLLGDHNVENILTAALVSKLAGVRPEAITKVAREFAGVEHRLEFIRDLNQVTYYNDSISTTPDRAIAGLKAMTKPTILIAGGYDKHLPFDLLAQVIVEKCKHLIVLGVTAHMITDAVKTINSKFPVDKATSLSGAVSLAANLAAPGDVVLLSPACASYDMFKNYQERGMLFKTLVNELSGLTTN